LAEKTIKDKTAAQGRSRRGSNSDSDSDSDADMVMQSNEDKTAIINKKPFGMTAHVWAAIVACVPHGSKRVVIDLSKDTEKEGEEEEQPEDAEEVDEEGGEAKEGEDAQVEEEESDDDDNRALANWTSKGGSPKCAREKANTKKRERARRESAQEETKARWLVKFAQTIA
jgi:hypothetical protein